MPRTAAFPRPLRLTRLAAALLAVGALAAAMPRTAQALPQGAQATYGQTSVQQTASDRLEIRQTTERAGLDWQRFSIGAGETVKIVQPGSGSVLLNRVVGADPSVLLGRMESNGRVFLSNPQGVIFGRDSQLNLGSLVATTLDISKADAAEGRYLLTAVPGRTPGALQADGRIVASGSVVLVAPDLSVGGSITAPRVGLAAASSVLVDVDGDGMIFFDAKNDAQLATRLSVLGQVRADGGTAELRALGRAGFADTVLNLEGVVQARGLGVREGRVVIDGGRDGVTRVAGTVDVASDTGRGGSATLLGERILLDRGAVVDASGVTGGGTVRIGGAWQGSDEATFRHADVTAMMPGATVKADATRAGDGGEIVLWSDGATRFHGVLSARGGPERGNGGRMEVSSKGWLDFAGTADGSAPRGTAGLLLLDPRDLEIGAVSDLNGDGTATDDLSGNTLLATAAPTNGTSQITSTRVQNLLTGVNPTPPVNVSLAASRNITVMTGNPIDASAAGSGALTLTAGSDIFINASVAAAGGITLTAGAGTGQVRMGAGASLNAGSSTLTISGNGPHELRDLTAGVFSLTGPATLMANATWNLSGTSSIAGALGGSFRLTKAGAGELTLGNAGNTIAGVTVTGGGSVAVAADGALGNAAGALILDNGTLRATGALTLARALTVNAGGGTLQADAGTAQFNGLVTATGPLAVAGAGVVSLGNAANTIGDLTIGNGATLAVGNAGQVGSTGTLAIAGGTLRLDAGLTIAKNISTTGGTITTATGNSVLTGTLTGSGTLLKNGGNRLTLAGGGTNFTGTLEVGAGTLALNGGGQLANAALVLDGTSALLLGAADSVASLDSGSATTAADLAGAQLTVGAGTFAGQITGAGAGSVLRKTGNGTFRPTNAGNDYAGDTVVAGGTLEISAAGQLGAGNLQIANATLHTTGDVSTTKTLAIGAGGARLDVDTNRTLTLNGVVSGAAGNNLSKLGDGSLVLGNAGNGYLGDTVVTGGELVVGSDGALGGGGLLVSSGAALHVTQSFTTSRAFGIGPGGATLNVDSGAALTLNSLVTGGASDALVKIGNGDVSLGNAANSYAGGTQLLAGAVIVGADGQLGDPAGGLVFDGGRLRVDVDFSSARTMTFNAGGGTVDVNTPGFGTTVFSGNLVAGSGTGGLTKTGTGVLRLAGANNGFGRAVQVNQGTLEAAGGQALGDLARVTLAGTATLRLLANETLGSLESASPTTLADLNGFVLTTGGNGLDAGFDGQLFGVGSRIDKVGGGTWRLGNLGNFFNGGLDIGGGTVSVADGAALGAGTLGISNGARLLVTGTTTINNAVNLGTGGGVIAVDDGNAGTTAVATLAGATGGSGSLTKSGADTLVLAGANNAFAGDTIVAQGLLRAQGGAAIGDGSAVSIAAGATLTLANDETIGALNDGAGGGGTANTGGFVLTLGGGNLGGSFSGTLAGGGTVAKTGSGTQVLGGANNAFAGGFDVRGGVLAAAGGAAIGDGSMVRVGSTGTLRLDANETIGALEDGSVVGGTVNLNGRTLTTGGANLDTAFGGLVSGTGASTLVKQGTGVFALTRAGGNTHAGGTRIDSGTLAITADAQLGGGDLTLDGARLRLDAGLTLARAIVVGTSGGTIDANTAAGVASTLSGNLRNGSGAAGTLIKTGAGELRLSGTNNAFTGPLDVRQGTLALAGGAAVADTGTVLLASTASLRLDANETIGSLQDSTGGGGMADLNGRTLRTGGGAAGATAFSGRFTGSGTSVLVKEGSGVWALTGAADNDHAGGTVVEAGTLAIARGGHVGTDALTLDGGTLRTDAPVTVTAGLTLAAGGGTIDSNGSDSSFSGAIAGPGGLTKAGAGRVALTGSGAVAGDTVVQAGVLALSGGATLAAADVQVASGAELALEAAGRLTGTPALQVAGRVSLAGDETVSALGGTGVIALAQPATLTAVLAGSASFGGTLTGDGGFALRGGTLTLTADSDYTGRTTVGNGTLRLVGALLGTSALDVEAGGRLEQVGDQRLRTDATLHVAGTLQLAGTENVGRLEVAGGSLGGTGTVNAAQYALDGAQVGANVQLGAGVLTSQGATTLQGRSAAGSVSVDGGTLVLAGTGRLTAAPVTTVLDGAVLQLGGDTTLGSLAGGGKVALGGATLTTGIAGDSAFTGVVEGSGRLVKEGTGTFTLGGSGTVDQLRVAAGVLALDGTLVLPGGTAAAPDVQVDTGATLRLGAPERLSDTAALRIDGRLELAGAERVGSLDLAGGVLAGNGTLSAATYLLDGGSTLAGADLGAGALTSRGVSRIGGQAGASTVAVETGTLTVDGAQALAADAAVTVAAGATWQLGGTQTIGSLAGAGKVELTGSVVLTTGALGDTTWAGELAGSGGLQKAGGSTTFTLTGTNTYTGPTTIAEGTLRIGDGGSTGSLASADIRNAGTLRFERSDTATLGGLLSGPGELVQAGSGTLQVAGAAHTNTGVTRVLSGTLATSGDEQLSDAADLVVASGATLALGGRETLKSITADGAVRLGGDVTTTGDQTYLGTLAVTTPAGVRLQAQQVVAENTGNDWGAGTLSLDAQSVRVEGGTTEHLQLGALTLAAGDSRIAAGSFTLTGDVSLLGGTLTLVARAAPTVFEPVPLAPGKLGAFDPLQPSRPLQFANNVVEQTGGVIRATGGALTVNAEGGGSIALGNTANDFTGGLSGTIASLPDGGATPTARNLSHFVVAGQTVVIGAAPLEADVIGIQAVTLATPGTGDIGARLTYNDTVLGTLRSLPGLTLTLDNTSFTTPGSFGTRDVPINVRVGNDGSALNAGYVTIDPKQPANRGATAVFLAGPPVADGAGGYRFFYDGAGKLVEVPVAYNGVLPTTPQQTGAISAAIAVSEQARKERFEEAVRTENVAVRLRAGVIAEVGPGRPATQGSEGIRLPAQCDAGQGLSCAP